MHGEEGKKGLDVEEEEERASEVELWRNRLRTRFLIILPLTQSFIAYDISVMRTKQMNITSHPLHEPKKYDTKGECIQTFLQTC